MHPGSRHPRVGGSYDGALEVRVAEHAVNGAANAAVIAAMADAFGVRRTAVALQRGQRSRTKVIAIDGDSVTLARRLAALLESYRDSER